MDTTNLLREGIAAVKAGQRQYARELFLELVELDPTNDLAWMWLSGLLDSREEQIKALENSLAISKGGPELEKGLHHLGHPEIGPELARFRSAVKLIEAGNRSRGRTILEQIIAENKDNERAWMAMSGLSEDDEEQVTALENVIRINPNNFKARERLTTVQHKLYQHYLQLGRVYQRRGELKQAIGAYQSAERFASTGSFRAAAQQRWQMIQSVGQDRRMKTSHSTVTLVRMAIGPPLIFVILVFIQSGLNTGQMLTFIFCLSGLAVTLGSLLAVASTYTPYHPLWIRIWGEKGLTDNRKRILLRNLGILIMLVPFIAWLLSAIGRLDLSSGIF
jgi:tetratricopeptide (TPR) repeat protein